MKKVLKFRWPIFIVLAVLTVVLFVLAPDLAKQAEDAGSFQLPSDADSQKAADILEKAGASDETISLVYPLEEKADERTKQEISKTASDIKAIGKPVTGVLDPFENEEMEKQLVSEDGKTVLLPITVDGADEEIVELADRVKSDIVPKDRKVYMTGEAIINNDVNLSAQEGLKKTELITIGLIFGLLLIVFRSPITPLIPLLAVGMTYLLSQSLVAFFVDWFGFPVSNYTQIFLVAILFGLGTDYCILLLSRYKEELLEGHDVEDAIVNTYRTAGRTLFISAAAVFIGFAAIGFAQFPIFKSAVAVAVGIATLLLILTTVVPLFMMLLKDKLFWPAKGSASHKDSKLWIRMSGLSVMRPLLSMAVVAIITIPLLLTYDNDLSFKTVDEVDSSRESVMGLNRISDAFGEGDSLPVGVILKKDGKITDEDTVPYLERISEDLEKVKGVKDVRTITRPTGEPIEDLYADRQIGLMADGLEDAIDGIAQVQDGLGQAKSGLDKMASGIPSGGTDAGAGLGQAASGLGQINDQLARISGGLRQGMPAAQAAGALDTLGGELGNIQAGLNGAAGQMQTAGGQMGQLSGGLGKLSDGIGSAEKGLGEISGGLSDLAGMMQDMGDSKQIRETGVFIPKDTLENDDFAQVLERYTIDEESGILLEVILDEDPYSREAIGTVDEIKASVEKSVIGTPFEDADVYFDGISVMNADLDDISSSDFSRTVTIMLVGLFIVLFILFRSAIMPLYMIGSLLLTYYTSVSVTELIFVNGLGYDGISWAVPFFGFIMLIALGVDYSIFLLDRFREESINRLNTRDALKKSMAKMGTVIITAAVILAGTFGAMMPSGVLSLVQIATIVITGLLLYGLIILPLLIPAITVSFGRGVWWPFRG
ncbi:MMPL family transporter [Edaphobacillus lindanitolerans]|uniref:Putative drug exporter of the RND superfamily n=1 Tax=Edaphobacillus lindanitolerans TaxID=550447 RepID=A0A1U7PMY0_9BACI|nr:MMPL family transporter [Edaphobacillus lindanitolerans]SIT71491.1 putative drug exporter of the RND superfamily [Edaphobacillus lindanitolerans]